jgi:predicted dehydrogenase
MTVADRHGHPLSYSPVGSPDRPLRGAIIGTGSIAEHHMISWSAIEDADIVAIADVDAVRGPSFAARHAVDSQHVHQDHVAMFETEDLDFVDIASPPHVHKQHALDAARAGVHVFCQKPFMLSLEDADVVIATCVEEGVRCVVNENWRWRSWYRRVEELVRGGAVGRVDYISITCHRNFVLPNADGSVPYLIQHHRYIEDVERFIILDWGIHLLDVMRAIAGPIATLDCQTQSISPLVKGEDRALMSLTFASGASGLLDISFASRTRDDRTLIAGNVEPMIIEGELGRIELDPWAAEDMIHLTTAAGTSSESARPGIAPADAYQDSFRACQSNFVSCLRTGAVAVNEAHDNRAVLAAALASYEAAATGRRIRVS